MAKKLKPVDWPARVKAILKANDWTHAELAKRIGVTRGAVGHYVTGYSKPNSSAIILFSQLEKIQQPIAR